jgi:hypothetical protein
MSSAVRRMEREILADAASKLPLSGLGHSYLHISLDGKSRLVVIPAKAGIQFKYVVRSTQNFYVVCCARHFFTGFRLSPE